MSVGILTDRLALPRVTLAAVTSVAVEATAAAVARCIDQADFAEVLWISDQSPPEAIASLCRWIIVPRIDSRIMYSDVMLHDLANFVRTSHVLCVQWDGYILDAQSWSPSFLDYDYIGAPWHHFPDGPIVGNGGFSLRSAKLLKAGRHFRASAKELEDVLLCRVHRARLEEEFGVRFAPVTVAQRFSFERGPETGQTFGFHGAFNLVRILPPAKVSRFLAQLELPMLSNAEHREMIRWAIRRGRWRVAAVLALRLFRRWRGRRSTRVKLRDHRRPA